MTEFSRRSPNAQRTHQLIVLNNLNETYTVSEVIYLILEASKQGFEEIEMSIPNIQDGGAFYPNVIVPISAYCDFMRSENNLSFKLVNTPRFIENTNILGPLAAGKTNTQLSILNKVWRFNSSEDVFKLVTEYLDEIYKQDEFKAKDVLVGLEWCLNEIMDNVIQHADTNFGYIMGQIHPTTKHVAFCIVDCGRGILASLMESSYRPATARDALTLAIKEGVTRDNNVGQGNGLWGLSEIVKENNGSLRLSSSGESLNIIEGTCHRYAFFNKRRGGTVIDFQMDYSKPISLKTILNGHEPESVKLLQLTDNPSGVALYLLKNQKSGFGTRKSGERIRNEIKNILNQTHEIVEIDFSEIGVVSSSFADELLGKLYAELGPIKFNSSVRIKNMTKTVEAIIDKAIRQRLTQEQNTKM